ncbi:hypothetical protein IC235_07085 [Hymenobacter sp. BT664]|uniref:Uncharacterized protein n=1 Tax=Hymenobacter montanus TaxID=2771359 RepID=A0A927BCV9_9BACT|nr:hypothetical protein [Hymenobacter montanus]MBD2767653.1 hypothetical protein [Hymenobacter montanus]
MRHQTLATDNPQTIAWVGNEIIDWVSLRKYGPAAAEPPQISRKLALAFDRAITSADGQYAFLYQVLGTKGVLLRNGEPIREINRDEYLATGYEYPAAFATVDGVTYLVHCPLEYCRIDFENVETGELVTNIPSRQPMDRFHSRFEVSPEGGYLLSKGWLWHPWDMVELFDIRACLANPLLLDESELSAPTNSELCSAGFISETQVLLGASTEEVMDDEEPSVVPPGHLAVWNFIANEFSQPLKVLAPFGNLFPIDAHRAWDLYQYPKIINLDTGEVMDQLETLNTGRQCSSIIRSIAPVPAIIFNRQTGQVAVKIGANLELLSVA